MLTAATLYALVSPVQLYVDELESKAEKKLAKEIDRSLNSSYRRFDNFIHNVKHG